MFNNFINIHELTKYKPIDSIVYKNRPPEKLLLHDLVIVYNDGRNNKIYDLDFLSNNPIIYDKYYDSVVVNSESGLEQVDVTITHCQISLSTIIYFGKYKLSTYVYRNNIVIQNVDDDDEYILQLSGEIYSKKSNSKIDKKIFRVGTKIMTLRQAISNYPDGIFNDDMVKNEEILFPNNIYNKIFDEIYLELSKHHHKIDPKTIIYGIEYYSSDEATTKKFSAIVNKNTHTNFNLGKSFEKYFSKTISKLLEKGAFITPCYFGPWVLFHPKTKIIYI